VAIWDTVISVWTYKYIWDTARPITVIPCLYVGQNIRAWAGRYKGTADIPASKFQSWVPTPNFPEFASGHSSFSAASAQVLRSFFGSDK
jgi:membrane-associated phospholipid phosphatase